MRYYTLLFAGFLPAAVLAQSAPSAGTGFAHPTGGVASKNESVTWYKPVPVRHSSSSILTEAKLTGVPSSNKTTIATESSTPLSSTSKPSHKPYTKSAGLFFSNTTSGFTQPTGPVVYVSGTGSSHPSGGISSGFAKPTAAEPFTKPVHNITTPVAASGRLPFSSGAHFFNETSTAAPFVSGTGASHPSGTGVSHPSGGISSGFAKPTAAGTVTKLVHNSTISVAASGRLPFSSGAHFFNGTSTAAPFVSGTGVSHPSGGISSGFAKPTAAGNFTSHVQYTTVPASKPGSVRLPLTKGQSAFYGNGTSSGVPSSTQVFYPTGTAVSSGFAKPTAITNYTAPSTNRTASGRIPYTRTGALSSNSTVVVLPTGVIASTGLFSPSVVPTTSGHLPFTKSSGAFFSNSTSSRPILSTGTAFSSGSLPTAIFSTGAISTGISRPMTTALPGLNSTSINLPSLSTLTSSSTTKSKSKTKKPHNGHTVTVTITAAPITITQAGTTVTDYTTLAAAASSLPSNGTESLISADETATVTVVQSLSSGLPLTTPSGFISSVAGANLAISTSAASNTTASTINPSAPTTLVTLVSSVSLTSSPSATSSAAVVPIAEYYQCGGLNWVGSGECAAGTVCKYWNPYYSQCVDEASA